MAKAKRKLTPRELQARRDHYARNKTRILKQKKARYRKDWQRIRARENAAKRAARAACTPNRRAQ